jgi:alpha-glucuronidase
MRRELCRVLFFVSLLAIFSSPILQAETGKEAWLRYAPLTTTERVKYRSLPASAVLLGDSPVLHSAQQELIRGVKGLLGETLRTETSLPQEAAIVLGTADAIEAVRPEWQAPPRIQGDGFVLSRARIHGYNCLLVLGADDRGVLYATFALLRKIALGEDIASISDREEPAGSLRWVDQWDNLNGTIERGYGGRSIFFDNGVRADLTRVSEYGRLLASVGINGCSVNNVNADPKMLDDNFLPQLARIADAFRPWGVRIGLAVDFGSPKSLGGLDTFDPLDPKVAEWWTKKVAQVYAEIPDFGGFTVKADSEGRPGPASYGRTAADAANVIARALKPHGGVVFYRAFVYDHHLDPNNPKNDRARAAYDIFHPLDGKFDDNVVLQIKNGPIDFQVREPASPLFGGLAKTNEAIELQITQEYLGQGRHLVFLPPMWKETLDFDLHANRGTSLVKDLITGKTFHRPAGGFVGVSNVGLDPTWLGNPLTMANFYGFGRLAWNPSLSSSAIVSEWTRLTFGGNPNVVQTVDSMQLASWPAYNNYTGPLGLQTLTDITGSHFGPNVEASENNGWGQWHRADHEGVGMDRTMATGTGYVGQYSPAVQKLYESLAAMPDNLLLFFHHVPYTYKSHSGETVIQDIYDSHYAGAQQAQAFVRQWKSLKGQVDEQRYAEGLALLQYQAGRAIVWRDAICNYFLRISAIPDAKGRVGHYPDRVEAESMRLEGYTAVDVVPAENASGGKAVECHDKCSATYIFKGQAGEYELDVEYFDQNTGASAFRVLVNNQVVDEWTADDHFPSAKIGGDTSTRRPIPGLALRPGDAIHIEGVADGQERAALDYIEIFPQSQ